MIKKALLLVMSVVLTGMSCYRRLGFTSAADGLE